MVSVCHIQNRGCIDSTPLDIGSQLLDISCCSLSLDGLGIMESLGWHFFGNELQEFCLGDEAIFVGIEELVELQHFCLGVAWSNTEDELGELTEVKRSTVIEIYLIKDSDWVSFDIPQNRNDLINLSGEDVLSASVINLIDEMLNFRPLQDTILIVIQVIKQHADLMSGNLRVDLSQESLEDIIVKFLFGVLVAEVWPFTVAVLVCVCLKIHKDLSDVGLNDDLFDVVSALFVLHERMIEDVLPAHALLFINHECPFQEILSVLSDLGIVRETKWFIADSVKVLIQASAGPRSIAKDHLIQHEAQAPNI